MNITVTDDFVEIQNTDGTIVQMAWSDINEIKIITTDAGPFSSDVFLSLIGTEKKCLLPQDAPGYDAVYDHVSEYPGFNFTNMIESMSCTENKEFPLWSRK
ncbi:hypothetical protein KBD59_01460 [Candidatus Gracilibacteria bacterium]|nr:hypothetical protein [Candidatus Gracilibacteria bacterium]